MSDDGRVSIDKHAIRHLRDAFDRVRPGWGHSLISCVPGRSKHCYALMAGRDQIRVDPSIERVRLTNCVPKEIIDALLVFATDQ